MKHVLILAYDFPPYASAGALRPYFWAKYLAQQGHKVSVITRQWDLPYQSHLDYIAPSKNTEVLTEILEDFMVVRCPYSPSLANRIRLKNKSGFAKMFGKVLSAWTEMAQFILPIGPKRSLFTEGSHWIEREKPDIILATGDPFILFQYAAKWSRQHQIPWIADYRDPWSQDLTVQANPILKQWYRWNEKRLVKTAHSVTTVSEFLAENLKQLLPEISVNIIPNGYDQETIDRYKSTLPQNKVLKLGLAGTIYPWNPIEGFLEQLANYVNTAEEPSIELHLYGINLGESIELWLETRFLSLKNVVFVHPKIPYENLIQELSQCDVLLLFNYYSSMGTKIYDYLGLNRKILFCYGNDPESNALKNRHYRAEEFEGVNTQLQQELILQKNAGIIVESKSEIPAILHDLVEEHRLSGLIASETKNTTELSRKGQTQRLSEWIEHIA